MRFTLTIVVGAFAVAASADSSTSTSSVSSTTSSTTTSTTVDAAQQSEANCLNACSAGDVNCQAKCVLVPNPNPAQVNATTTCVANCSKGDGSPSAVSAYTDCLNKCISDNYYSASVGTPQTTGSSGSGSGSSSSGSGSSGTSTKGSGSGSSTGSSTGSSSSSSSTGQSNAAVTVRYGASAVGLVGFVAAIMAL